MNIVNQLYNLYNMKKLLILFFSVVASVAMFAQSITVPDTVTD